MPKRYEIQEIGSGITRSKRERLVFDLTKPLTSDELTELGKALTRMGSRPPWDRVRSIVDDAQRHLERIAADTPDLNSSALAPHDSPAWYYKELINLDRLVRRRIEVGDAAHAAYFAVKFGSLHSELQIKLVWERDALSGRKAFSGAVEGGKTRGSSDKIRDRKVRFYSAYDSASERGKRPVIARQIAAREAGYTDDHARRLLKQR